MSNADYLQSSVVYFEDAFVPFAQANISIASAANQYGLSVYTALNVFADGEQVWAFRLRDHYDRLVNSSRILGMTDFRTICSYLRFKWLVSELVRRNDIDDKAIVRINYYINSLMAGTVIHSQPTELSMFVLPFGDYFHKSELSVMVSSWRRVNDNSIPARAKITGSYVNSALMKSEALLNGFDDCIALDEDGHVSESAVANVFLVRGTTLVTPGVNNDILEGITRDTTIKLAVGLGIQVEERPIDRSELYIADEIFITGSSAKIWPVTAVDHRPVGSGEAGKLTKRLTVEYATLQQDGWALYPEWIVPLTVNKKGVRT